MEYQKISGRFTCRFCKEQFDLPKALYTHLQQVHTAAYAVKDNRTCPLCGVQCAKYEGYRDHLLYIHGQRTESQKLVFKTLNDFLLWKTELEKKYSCKYILQSAPKILPSNDKKYFYQCDRSESRERKEKKISTVVKKTCPSMISVVECSGHQQFKVEYWDTHSEHNFLSNPVPKDELTAATSSIEMVQAIDDDQTYEKNEDLNLSGEANGAFSKSLGKESQSKKSHAGSSSTAAEKTSKFKNSLSKTDVMQKKGTANSCLYSLASVACMKGINKKSKANSTSDIESKSKEVLSVPTKEAVSPKKISVKDSEKTDNENLNSGSLNQPKNKKLKKDDTTPLKPDTPRLKPDSARLKPDSARLKLDTSHLKPLAPKETPTSTIVNSSITNTNAFSGQVLLINPVPVGQNTTQSIFPSGQNILFSFNPVGQNVTPAVLPIDQTAGEKVTTPAEKKVSPRKKTAGAKNASEVQSTESVSQISTKNNNMKAVTKSSPISAKTIVNTPSNAVLLSALPVGSTYMNVNNNLIPMKNSAGKYLSPELNSGIVLAPAVPSTVVTSNIPSSSVNITPKPTISTGVTSCIPILSNLPASVISTTSGSNSRDLTLSTSSSLTSIPPSVASMANTLTLSNNLAKNTISTSNQSVNKLNTSFTETAPNVTARSLQVDAQKPGTLLFESSGNVYMLEPIDNDLNVENAVDSNTGKTENRKAVEACSSSEKSLLSKRPYTDNDDAGDTIVAQKMRYYQLELKYLSCQEDCKRMKLELAKAEKLNRDLSKKNGVNIRKEEGRKSSVMKGSKQVQLIRELEDNFGDDDADIYIMTRSSVLRNLYLEVEELSEEKSNLLKELEEYRNHDRFYKMLRKKLDEEEF